MVWYRASPILTHVEITWGPGYKAAFPSVGVGRAPDPAFLSSPGDVSPAGRGPHLVLYEGIGHRKGFVCFLGREEVGAGLLAYHFMKVFPEYYRPRC